jgi:tRNA pseudouridine13 synthase
MIFEPFDLNWAYRLGKPKGNAVLKAQADDFIVTEQLGYELSGSGEHIFLWVEKQQLNTAFAAEALAKHTGLPLRQVTYAGRKDKHAVTRQWFGLHAPKGLKAPLDTLDLPGFTILSTHRHHKKLKVGQLQGNHFAITLRNVTEFDDIEQRLHYIQQHGVPNYFGDQRFGVRTNEDGSIQRGGTLALGLKMVSGEPIRNRNKQNLALSALRSAIFNSMLSARIAEGFFDEVKAGDACVLVGSNSYFIEHGDTLTASLTRYQKQDISPTAALVGTAKSSVIGGIAEWEARTLKKYSNVMNTLIQRGVSSTRRAIKIWPKSLEWQRQNDKLHIQFSLPAGCFATSVLRECVQFQPANDSGND